MGSCLLVVVIGSSPQKSTREYNTDDNKNKKIQIISDFLCFGIFEF